MKLSDIPPDEFAHFGVKGQKWGVRKKEESSKQEKTISEKTLAKREKKAEKFDIKADMYQTRISQLEKVAPKNIYQKRIQKGEIKDLTKFRDQAIKDAEAKRQGKLSKGQKQAVAGAAVVAALVTAATIHNTIESGEGRRRITKGKLFLEGKDVKDYFKKDMSLTETMSHDELMTRVVKPINPNYGEIGTKNNCRRATLAYEMRRRGNDVDATRTGNARGQSFVGLYNATQPNQRPQRSGRLAIVGKLMREGQAPEDQRTFTKMLEKGGFGENVVDLHRMPGDGRVNPSERIFKALSYQPDGARGELGVTWRMGGGHSVAWEMIGGKPVVIDTQSGKMFKSAADMAKEYGQDSIATAAHTRLDNRDLNTDFLLRWVKNVKS